MRIHYLQHVPFEGLGHIAHWARLQNHSVTSTAMYNNEPLPELAEFDALVVMGGPMGVHDTSIYSWMIEEKHFIERVIGQNKPLLGICLGAQFIADVLGAKVYPNAEKEIGWYPVTRASALDDALWNTVVPDQFQAFHWHGDTFELPAGAMHLAQSTACRHQAFFYPPATLGLQFHLESTRESIGQLIEHCSDELVPAPFIQSAADIQNQSDLIPASNLLMDAILIHSLGRGSI